MAAAFVCSHARHTSRTTRTSATQPTPLFHYRVRVYVEREIPQAEVSAEFTEKIGELRRVLATDLLVEPHRFGDRPIEGGVALATLLTEVCGAVNEGSNDLVPLR